MLRTGCPLLHVNRNGHASARRAVEPIQIDGDWASDGLVIRPRFKRWLESVNNHSIAPSRLSDSLQCFSYGCFLGSRWPNQVPILRQLFRTFFRLPTQTFQTRSLFLIVVVTLLPDHGDASHQAIEPSGSTAF
jgi:hypothetical protein